MSLNIVNKGDGFPRIILTEPTGSSAEVLLYGGQVVSWKNERREELLFMSSKATWKPPKAIRGGIPVCFPQFGNLGSLEQHGFAKNRLWSVDSNPSPLAPTNNQTSVDLILKSTEEDLKTWPRSEVRVEGLETLDYLDNLMRRERFTEQADAITFDEEVNRVYLGTPTKIAMIDHERKRTFVLRKDGMRDAVVWNPWDKKAKTIPDLGDEDYKTMLCVDSAAIETPIFLKPSEEWKGRQELSTVSSSYCSGQLDPRMVLHGLY
ncbi:glucose-6-phosphate 1-epimerase [Pyrus ussuriensis x Pyrus communis]|uniref:glucose-6-phosphate 1-epimerase n=1 Tax=Pyrus ussuriensis x Pyrus communis TaxID=2448454 RepID=A0A5N5FNZ2_9ROSA|nr:putative glucose-6-phosphate 1-epimerase isoform X2 [Pyrus x bretschneideri]KAB2604879.1 glucose-6-phosphate 1-epimerase [Pyrus ussuriensis x Pyrus communis]